MPDWRLLWLMVLKESRTTMRERAQLRGLLVSVLVILLVVCNVMYTTSRAARHTPGLAGAMMPHPASAYQQAVARWAAIAACAGIGFFFSMGYLMSAVLACFVGEKEARTLEILLAAPLSDEKLFAMKATSVLLPSVCIGAMFAVGLMAAAKVFIPAEVVHLPDGIYLYAPILGVIAMALLQAAFVGLGAAISAKAETMKGATQSLGVVFTVCFFGLGYGLPLLLENFPSLKKPFWTAWGHWMEQPFARQYGFLLLALGVPAVILLRIGRACFRRDRMLS